MQIVQYSNLNGAGNVEYMDWEPANYTNGGFTLTSVGNATATVVSNVTMTGSAKAIILKSTNSAGAGDRVLSVVDNALEEFWVGAVNATQAGIVAVGNYGLAGDGPFYVKASSGSSGCGIDLDATAQTSGRQWALLSEGNIATSGGQAAGDFLLYDITGAHTRMVIKNGGTAAIGDSSSLGAASVVLPGTSWDMIKNSIAATQSSGATVADLSASTAGVPVQNSPILELAGHVWNTTPTAADNYATVGFQMIPTSAGAPTTEVDLRAYVGTSNTRTWGSPFLKFFDTGNIFTTGIFSTYNNETTAGLGAYYIRGEGQDVASSGLGAQNTTIATFTPAAGQYLVDANCSATTADNPVTVVATYTDAVNTTAQTVTLINAVSVGTNGVTSGHASIRTNTSAVTVKITASGQATTKCGAAVSRYN
jgi:hypothetical protein